MSQGNIIQGQASGKLGDTVLMVRNGKQVARVYTTSGARSGDAASQAARLQRVRFGAASNQWQLYRYICTRMFRKGRSTNQSDYNYFVKRNVELLPYLTRLENADGVCCLQPGQFSEGNLGRIELLQSSLIVSASGLAQLRTLDTINMPSTTVSWTATVATLKAQLQRIYINARKVTYLLISTSNNEITEGGESFTSQFYQHFPVVLDLYAETTEGENAMTLAEFFASKISNEALSTLVAAQTVTFMLANGSFYLRASETTDNDLVLSLSCLIFATNDLVSDCYTTLLPESAIPTTVGPYAVWASYRTAEALQIAADSYGYQSGVMRDEVAANGGADTAQIAAYAQRLHSLSSELSSEFIASLSEENEPLARAARAAIKEE